MADTNELIANMMSSLGMEDMNIPELKINQATGGDFIKEAGAKLGALYNSTTGEVMDEVSVQLLHIQKNRTYWGRSDITDDPPICSSQDGKMSVEGITCKTGCPYHAFRDRASMDKEERRKECQAGFVVLALDEQQMPLVIRLNGISADAGRNLAYQAFWNKALKANPGGFYFRVLTSKKKTASGEAYEFKFLLRSDKFPSLEASQFYGKTARELLGLQQQAPLGQRLAEVLADPANQLPPADPNTARQQQVLENADKLIAQEKEKNPPAPPEETIPDIKF